VRRIPAESGKHRSQHTSNARLAQGRFTSLGAREKVNTAWKHFTLGRYIREVIDAPGSHMDEFFFTPVPPMSNCQDMLPCCV